MRIARWSCCLALLLLPLAACAQTDAEEIAATLDALLAAAQAGDAEALGELITDPCVVRTDPFDEVLGRAEFLEQTAAHPTPTDFTLGEFEPWIGQGAAYALVPMTLGPETPPVIQQVRLATLFVEVEDAWKVAAMVMLVTINEEDPNAAPLREMQPNMMTSLQRFGQQLQGLTANGNMVGFTKLCHENALLGAANEETGAIELATAAQIEEALEAGEGFASGLSPSANPEMVMEMGFGGVFTATTMDFLGPDGATASQRLVGLVSYILPFSEDDAGEWLIVAALRVPPAE